MIKKTLKKTAGRKSPKAARRVDAVDVQALVVGLFLRDRVALARAITLVESDAPQHQAPRQDLLEKIYPFGGNSIRVGVTGVPGAGKSTFIDALGFAACEAGRNVFVLAVDPSSPKSGGSLLGDKTRMSKLAQHPRAFVRPSPSRGALGGIAARAREVVLVAEAAGFDMVLIETLGVGQGEIAVRAVVDLLLLLTLTGGGDELQSMKRGILELADIVVVNKADGENGARAKSMAGELQHALALFHRRTDCEPIRVHAVSAIDLSGIREVLFEIVRLEAIGAKSGRIEKHRAEQSQDWFDAALELELSRLFFADKRAQSRLEAARAQVARGDTLPSAVAHDLVRDLTNKKRGGDK